MSPAAAPKGTGILTGAAGARHARIWGVGGYRPERVVPNAEIVEAIDSSDEWIQERSGIKSRRWAGPDETVVTMSVAAAREAVAAAGIRLDQIEAVIVSTVSHPYQTPAAAPIVADALGLRCVAFQHPVPGMDIEGAALKQSDRFHTDHVPAQVGLHDGRQQGSGQSGA